MQIKGELQEGTFSGKNKEISVIICSKSTKGKYI